MKKWKLVTGVLIVFVLGVLVGSLGTRLYTKHYFVHRRRDPSAMRAFLLKKFSKELNLTEAQKNEFKRHIDQVGNKLDDHFRKSHSEIGKIVDQGSSQMRKELSPDQQKRFDQLIEKFRKHRKPRAKFGSPAPPGRR